MSDVTREREKRVLELLAEHGSLTLEEIANLLMEFPEDATRYVSNLEERGLVSSRRLGAGLVGTESLEAFTLRRPSKGAKRTRNE